MNHRFLLISTILIYFNYSVPIYAFEHKKTHRELTEAAIKPPVSSLNSYLINNFGFDKGYDKTIKGINRQGYERTLSVSEWLQEGSTDEDALSFCRASRHFHNPIFSTPDPDIYNWDGSKMSDSYLVDIFCALATRYSDVTWATGYLSPTGPYIIRDGQDMGWDNARSYFYEALTSTDPAVKEAKFVKSFRTVGMVMHLLQDMAVPAHVRNDMSSHLLNSLDMSKWGSNPFEKYVVTHSDARNKAPIKPTFAAPIRLTDYWDNNSYTGNNPDFAVVVNQAVGANQGIAEYTNANFVSDFTIFRPQSDTKHYFKYPAESSTQKVNMHIANPFSPGDTLTRKYYLKTGNGDTGYLLAGVGYLKVKVQTWPDTTTIETLPPMDDYVHADYADRLLPRAVGYSAALLDYFFRGKINLTVATPENISFRSIKVRAENDLMGETMGVGEVKLIIRYKALSEWPLGGNKYQLNYPPEDFNPDKYTYKVSIPQYVDLTNPQTLTFDFSTDTLPYFYDDMTMQLVFKGKLGNEEGAVAVSQLEPINGVHSDFTVSLPASGVYAKATDSTLGATFNELKVTAQTDIPTGLTGGSFELALEYRKAGGDPFQSLPVDTEPANAAAYVIRVPEKNGVSILQPGTPVELVFDLSSVLLPVSATDVYLNIIYKNAGTSKTMAVGYRDISEPTPVDVFNNADKVCINKQWYNAGSPEAIALVNVNVFDPYAHDIANIFTKESSSSNATTASATNFTFQSPALLTGGAFRRLGYILTDYDFKYSFTEDWIDVSPALDPWDSTGNDWILPGTAVRNQTDSDGVYTYPAMFNMRGKKMWWGASIIFVNTDDEDSECGWNNL